MSPKPSPASIGLEYYFFVLKRQWYVVVGVALLGLAAAGAFLLLIPGSYTASTVTNINVISTEPFNAQKSAGGLLDGATETLTAKSYAVANQAAKLLSPEFDATNIRDSTEVTSDSGTSVVRISFEAAERESAVRGADAVTEAYLAYRSNQAEKRLDVMLKNISGRLGELRESLNDANSRNAKAKVGSAEANQAESDRHQTSIELEGLLAQKNILESVDTTGGEILTPAANNPVVEGPAEKRVLAAGVLAGIMAGLLVAFALNPFDRRLRNRGEFERALKKPVLASMGDHEPRIPAKGEAADQLRVARELVFSRLRSRESGLLILDDSGGTEISVDAINFAVIAAQAEQRVRLILPGVSDSQLERLTDAVGLVDERKRDGYPATYQCESQPYLTVGIPTDTDDPSQSDPLVTREVRSALSAAERATHYILVLKSDAHRSSLLASLRLMDEVLVVGREHSSLSDTMADLLSEAELLDVTVVGTVLVGRGQ